MIAARTIGTSLREDEIVILDELARNECESSRAGAMRVMLRYFIEGHCSVQDALDELGDGRPMPESL